MNKLNGLSLNGAVLLRDALETLHVDDMDEETIENRAYLLSQLYAIISNLQKSE